MAKIPESVLVVIHTPALAVLMIRRADTLVDFWQSVTGSKDSLNEPYIDTARREVWEETGIDCRSGRPLAPALIDWQLENIYQIYPQWRHRYAPGITHNVEHVMGLCVPDGVAVRLNPAEHTHYQWLPYQAAADLAYSPSNAEAILHLPRFALKVQADVDPP
ncbi:MAG: hypothetical protein RLZZ401_1349 [Pseudomonadota bacterium]|jgi:dATP pyrophosphohydrolase